MLDVKPPNYPMKARMPKSNLKKTQFKMPPKNKNKIKDLHSKLQAKWLAVICSLKLITDNYWGCNHFGDEKQVGFKA